MSDWHDEFAEPMHDTPAEKDSLVAFSGTTGRQSRWEAGTSVRNG